MADDDSLELSASTLAALNQFLGEEAHRKKVEEDLLSGKLAEDAAGHVEEDWNLSQFWYDEETALRLAKEAIRGCGGGKKVALISCPTTYVAIKKHFPEALGSGNIRLLEFDKTFRGVGWQRLCVLRLQRSNEFRRCQRRRQHGCDAERAF